MIRPLPCSRMWGSTARIVRIEPKRLVSNKARACSIELSSAAPETPTPSGVYHLTWRAKSRVSTDNAQWLLKWYFNFINSRGVSFHQFELPGYAASHACVRLLERDAMWLYGWGEQWKLAPGGKDVLQQGTVVVVSGQYGHDKLGPWTSLDWWTQLPVKLDNK